MVTKLSVSFYYAWWGIYFLVLRYRIKVISILIGLIYKNIAKMANKIFNVLNHLNRQTFTGSFYYISKNLIEGVEALDVNRMNLHTVR